MGIRLEDEEKDYIERNSIPLWFIIVCIICYAVIILSVVYLLSQAGK